MYPFRDKEMTQEWLDRAKEAGYEAIIVTLDSQWPPKRERNIRNNYRRTRGVNYPKTKRGDAEARRQGRRRIRSRRDLERFRLDQVRHGTSCYRQGRH